MRRIWRSTKILLLCLSLCACGWQLRDSQLLSVNLGAVQVVSENTQGSLAVELNRQLQRYGVPQVNSDTEASYRIVILASHYQRRTSALNAGARAAEYQLNGRVDFLVTDAKGNPLAPAATAAVERYVDFDETDILASDSQEQLIKGAMQQDIVRQILNQFSLIATKNAATGNAAAKSAADR